MADVKWIKIAADIFDNRKIRQIETMPEGDSIIVIWLKLMCLAGVVNDGGLVYFSKEIPYTEEMLATEFNRPLLTVRLALSTFERFGMIEIIDEIILLPSWEKYQSTAGLERVREQNRKRVAAHRQRQKLLLESNVTCNVTDNVTCNEHKKENKDKEIENIYTPVVEYLNQKAGTAYRATGKKTQQLIRARQNEGFELEDFKRVIDNKCAEWRDTEFEQYLRPETLFGTKFESYLNTKATKRSGKRQYCSGSADDLDGIL